MRSKMDYLREGNKMKEAIAQARFALLDRAIVSLMLLSFLPSLAVLNFAAAE
jgi:uncharacterized membrane protein